MIEKNDPKKTGFRIREIRKKLGYSMEQFAKKIDDKAKSGTISNWETGKNLPNNERLKRIAELGNVSVEYLLYGSLEEYTNNLIDDLKKELKDSDTINNGVIPFIIREIESQISQNNYFAPKDIESINRIFEISKKNALEKWTDLEEVDTVILGFLSNDLSNSIEEYKKYLYKDYYENDTHEISSGDKVSKFGDSKMEFLELFNKFQKSSFDELRYGEEKIKKLNKYIEQGINNLSTIHLDESE